MTPKARIVLKALLARFECEGLATFLPQEDKEALGELPTPSKVDFSPLLSSDSWMKGIHYSWFAPTLSQLPQETQTYLLEILHPDQAKGLETLLKLEPSAKKPRKLVRPYLSHFLKEKVIPERVLPKEHLPASELNRLLDLSKQELVHKIDLLGLHDLAAELRQIVDKTLLAKINDALNKEQRQFVQYCMKQAMKWVPPKMNLAGWDGSAKGLNQLLHGRGITRLAKALVGEDPSLQWHVCHSLDTGRGEAMMKVFAGKHDPAMIPYFKGQVLHLLEHHQEVHA